MKTLLLNHYKLIKRRGLITPETPLSAFMDKMDEEYGEFWNAYADDIKADQDPSSEFIQEGVDLVMVILNLFQHYGVDFEEELKKNIHVQEGRV